MLNWTWIWYLLWSHPLEIFTPPLRIGPFYLALITSLAVLSVIYIFYICFKCHSCWTWCRWINYLTYKKWLILRSESFLIPDWDVLYLCSSNMKCIVVEDVWPLTNLTPWEILFLPIAELSWAYYWIYCFSRSATYRCLLFGKLL